MGHLAVLQGLECNLPQFPVRKYANSEASVCHVTIIPGVWAIFGECKETGRRDAGASDKIPSIFAARFQDSQAFRLKGLGIEEGRNRALVIGSERYLCRHCLAVLRSQMPIRFKRQDSAVLVPQPPRNRWDVYACLDAPRREEVA
jgi:hypothetical protein